ncbi:hypothetical protein GO986_08805 [Deinococcus sp. HMF7620]|uniref:Uncharacterized protein n=1 Tax=Deinococcus arboris TaxID=2682977 RepID=A0A7C9M1P6_9DEIO|nr:hypothetical protein [Deinococcus arboris]MVN86862.1 hypothetical protein [Deinococcus arboris]
MESFFLWIKPIIEGFLAGAFLAYLLRLFWKASKPERRRKIEVGIGFAGLIFSTLMFGSHLYLLSSLSGLAVLNGLIGQDLAIQKEALEWGIHIFAFATMISIIVAYRRSKHIQRDLGSIALAIAAGLGTLSGAMVKFYAENNLFDTGRALFFYSLYTMCFWFFVIVSVILILKLEDRSVIPQPVTQLPPQLPELDLAWATPLSSEQGQSVQPGQEA